MPAPSNLKAEIAAAKQREKEVREVFEKYDADKSGLIEMDELTALLEDLGLLANLKTSTVEFAAAMFNEFDVNDDGVLSFEEFKGVYNAAKDDAAGKPRAPPKPKAVEQRTADDLDPSTQALREKAAKESAMRKAQEAEDRRKENAENKAKLAAAKGGDAKSLDDDMKRKRKEFLEAKKKAKAEAAAKLKAENAAMRAKLKNTKAATDNDVTDDVVTLEDGTVIKGGGRDAAAAASKARKAAEAEQLAQENAAMKDRIKNTGAATDNDITDDVEVLADGTVIKGGGRDAAAAASKARKEKEAANLAKENAEMKERIKNTGAATDNDITDDVEVLADGTVIKGGGRDAAAAASKARKDKEAAELAKENAEMKERIKNTGAATDNDITDDVEVLADGTVIKGGGRDAAAAASKSKKAAEAEKLSQENAAMKDKIKKTGAATDNKL